MALRLAVVKGYKHKKIRSITGISERTMRRLCALHRRTGDVVQKRTVDGRPRILNGFELSVGSFIHLSHEFNA
jgi:transposase